MNSAHDQMGNFIRELKNIRKYKRKSRKTRNTVIERKHGLKGLVCRLDTVKERISELKNIRKELPKLKDKEKKR